MSNIELPSVSRSSTREIQPRHPHREIAELLATAIVRMRAKIHTNLQITNSEVSLGFTANQRVNANPSYTQGVQE